MLTWNWVNKVLYAATVLREQQRISAPEEFIKFYKLEDRQLLRNILKGKDPRIQKLRKQLEQRKKTGDMKRQVENFEGTLTDAITVSKHIEVLVHHMEQGDYTGALLAMEGSQAWSAGMRQHNIAEFVLSDLALDEEVMDIAPWLKDFKVPLLLLHLGVNNNSNKREISFSIPHMDPNANSFFYLGHYFFWRWNGDTLS